METAYEKEQRVWRLAQEAELRKDGGWLSVAGLFWLHDGENPIGAAAECLVRLPASAAPASVGVLTLREGKVTLRLQPGVTARLNGMVLTDEHTLAPDTSGKPDEIALGSLNFHVIQRGKRIGIRLYDSNNPPRRRFQGMQWFPVTPAYRITARFVAYNPVKQLQITNVLGDTQPVPSPGYVVFTVGGQTCRLEAQATKTGLFFNFRDRTSGESTYPAGRFLETGAPENGKVILDFNQAVNPPCAFTTFATCPLPPAGNHLKVRIPAGEKTHHPES